MWAVISELRGVLWRAGLFYCCDRLSTGTLWCCRDSLWCQNVIYEKWRYSGPVFLSLIQVHWVYWSLMFTATRTKLLNCLSWAWPVVRRSAEWKTSVLWLDMLTRLCWPSRFYPLALICWFLLSLLLLIKWQITTSALGLNVIRPSYNVLRSVARIELNSSLL